MNEKIIPPAVDFLKNRAEYFDIRYTDTEIESLLYGEGTLNNYLIKRERGFGIRVLVPEGSVGFASSPILQEKEAKKISKESLEIARSNVLLLKQKFEIKEKLKPLKDKYRTEIKKDPFEIPLKDKIKFLSELHYRIKEKKGNGFSNISLHFEKEKKIFFSSEQREISQEIIRTGFGITLTIMEKGKRITRSFPASQDGFFDTAGFELLEQEEILKGIDALVEEIKEMEKAEKAKEEILDIIVEPPLLSLVIHETLGHPLELDRVMGEEKSFAGESYAKIEDLNKLKIGSEYLNLIVDGKMKNGLATYRYDDDGMETKREYIVKKGVLVNFLSSRFYSPYINKVSTGNNFASSYKFQPIIRIGNVSLEPGNESLKELIGKIDNGILISGIKSWSIDDKRMNFLFEGEIGYEIKKGKKTGRIFLAPCFSDSTINFWNKLDGVSDKKTWRPWGTPSCAKGEPSQIMPTCQASSYALFKNIKVFSK